MKKRTKRYICLFFLGAVMLLGVTGCNKTTEKENLSTATNTPVVTNTPKPTAMSAPPNTPMPTSTPILMPVTDISNFEYRYNIGYDENGKVVTDGSAGYVITGLKNTNLTEIYIPDCVVEIGEECFWGTECDYITKIVIPDSVKVIGDGAFGHCGSLREVVMPAELDVLGANAFKWCDKLESIKVPYGVTEIQYDTFSGCSSLKKVELPETVRKIGGGAFYKCSSLENITIPEGVLYVLGSTFYGCQNLMEVELPDTLERIDSQAFCDCISLTDIEIPAGVTAIGEGAFLGCTGLMHIEIPTGVTHLANYTFGGCTNLLTIRIPATVKTIGNWAFNDGFGDLENCIIITEEGAYAIKYAELNHIPYGVEESWSGVSKDLNELEGWNVEIVTNYEEDDFSTEVLQFRENEMWYIHLVFEGDEEETPATLRIDYSNALASMVLYHTESFAAADGDMYFIEMEENTFSAGDIVDIYIYLNEEVTKTTVKILGN